MKYGAELSRRSVPKWRAYNLDYNEIKSVIKKATSPDAPPDAIDAVYDALLDQYEYIRLFVQSKTGEIDRRVAQCEKLVNSIAEQDDEAHANSTSPTEAEQSPFSKQAVASKKTRQSLVYRLRQETVRLSKDVQHLARFIGVQRTGFRKLLKKYKKWSNSTALSERFLPILEDPKSFTNQDFTPTVLELSLLNNVLRQAKLTTVTATTAVPAPPLGREKLCMFDCEMVTSISNSATFWVHADNLVETKITLLNNLSLVSDGTQQADDDAELTFTTFLDSKKFSSIQNNTEPGQLKAVQNVQTILCSPVGGLRHFCIATLQPDQVSMLLNSQFDALNAAVDDQLDNLSKMAVSWVEKRNAAAISKVESKRTRFRYSETIDGSGSGANDSLPSSPNTVMDTPDIWATIDTDIKLTKQGATTQPASSNDSPTDSVEFPYSVLEVRWKGLQKPTWVKDLESSHLVHPVKGFSLYAHSVAVFYPDALIALPKWLKLIDQQVDIRKTPKPLAQPQALKKQSSTHAIPGQSILLNPNSETESLLTPSGHKYDYGSSSDETVKGSSTVDKPVVRYWNEFDDPEDGDQGIFVIIPQDDSDDSGASSPGSFFLDHDNMAYLISLTDRVARGLQKTKRSVLGWLGVRQPEDPEDVLRRRRARGLSTIYEEEEAGIAADERGDLDDEDDDQFEGYYYTSRVHAHHQRNSVLTLFYTSCFFLSFLAVSTLFGVLLGQDMAGVSTATFVFVVAGIVFAVGVGGVAMGLFMLRSEVPGAWHQAGVFASFFAVVCCGVGELAWLLL